MSWPVLAETGGDGLCVGSFREEQPHEVCQIRSVEISGSDAAIYW